MKYSNLTNKSNIFLKRFSHSSRHIKCTKLLDNINYINFLDFGSGDGQFFEYLKLNPKKNYFAYEPYKKMYKQFQGNKNFKNVKLIIDKNKLKKNFYDVVTVNEVIEHLPNKKILEIIKILKYILKKNSTIIISVPIEVGFSSLIKNIIRYFSKSTHEGLTMKNLFRSVMSQKIKRGKKKYFKSHIGFNHNDLRIILSKYFYIQKISYSPFSLFKSFLNSQIFFVCKM